MDYLSLDCSMHIRHVDISQYYQPPECGFRVGLKGFRDSEKK